MTTVSTNRFGLPHLGLGLGLRAPHIDTILRERPPVGWFEVITENALVHEGRLRAVLEDLRRDYPLVLHGVSMSLGGTDPLDVALLRQIKQLADELEVAWVSDHLCWTGHGGANSHDLLPVPYHEEALLLMAARVRQAQDILERPLLLENPSSYVAFSSSTMAEWDFVAALAERADCALLLDVNNIHVSARNHGFEATDWLDAVPFDRVVQMHVAGHTDRGDHVLDTHIGPVVDPVWALFARAQQRVGGCSAMLEWDDQIPDFATVWAEAERARPLMVDPPRPGDAAAARLTTDRPAAPATTGAAPTPPAARDTARLYGWMFDAVTNPRTEAARPGQIGQRVLPSETMQPPDRVAVYQRMYAIRRREALQEDFPAVRAVVVAQGGDVAFRALALGYAEAEPSTSWALEHHGAGFAAYLDGLGRPALADLARLEWAEVLAQLAPLAPTIDAARLAAVPPGQQAAVRLQPAPAARLLWLDHDVHGWRLAYEAARAPAADEDPPLRRTPFVVTRAGFVVRWWRLADDEARLLGPLLDGAPLGAAIERGAEQATDAAAFIAQVPGWLQRFVAEGVFRQP